MYYIKKDIELEKLICRAFDGYLNSEDFTRYLLMENLDNKSLNEFDLELELDDNMIHKVRLHCIGRTTTQYVKYEARYIKHNKYFLDILELEADMYVLYEGVRLRFDDCNPSNNRKYKLIIVSDKYKDYKEKLDIFDSRLTYEFQIDIRKYNWDRCLRYRDRGYSYHKFNNLKSYNVADLVSLKLCNIPAEEIGWVYEHNTNEVTVYIQMKRLTDYDENDINKYLMDYYLACKNKKRAKNKMTLLIEFNQSLVLDKELLTTLSLLNNMFDKIEIVDDIKF